MDNCELTYIGRDAIDLRKAREQHNQYCRQLAARGCRITVLTENQHFPDAAFVEDTAVVFDELAVITRPGAASRRAETALIADTLRPLRRLVEIKAPGTLEGGDILTIGRTVFAGLSSRTNLEGIEQLQAFLTPWGYTVIPVTVSGSLHLKTAITAVSSQTLLVNQEWIDTTPFEKFELIAVPAAEPWAGNCLGFEDNILMPAGNPITVAHLQQRGFSVTEIDISEFQKAEAGLTCMSLLFRQT